MRHQRLTSGQEWTLHILATMRHLSALGAALCTSLLLVAPVARAAPDAAAQARALAQEGGDLLDAKRYSDALERLTRAEALYHAPTNVLMMAQAHEGLGHLTTALGLYEKLAAEPLPPTAPRAFLDAQQVGKERLRALLARVPSILVLVRGLDAGEAVQVAIDGEPYALDAGTAKPADPGSHVVEVTSSAHPRLERTVVLPDKGGVVTVEMPLSAPRAEGASAPPAETAPPPQPHPAESAQPTQAQGSIVLPLVAFGVGAVGLGVGAVTGAISLSDVSESAKTVSGQPVFTGPAVRDRLHQDARDRLHRRLRGGRRGRGCRGGPSLAPPRAGGDECGGSAAHICAVVRGEQRRCRGKLLMRACVPRIAIAGWIALPSVAAGAVVSACNALSGIDDFVVVSGSEGGVDAREGDGASGPPQEGGDAVGDAFTGSGADANDAGSGDSDAGPEAPADAGSAGDSSVDALVDAPTDVACATATVTCDGACPTMHSNGLGQSFYDCVPAGTYDVTQALEACAAFTGNMTLCNDNPIVCSGSSSEVCSNTFSSCACWQYTGLLKGRVVNSGTTTCGCVPGGATRWN